MPGGGGSARASTRGAGGGSGAMISVATVLPLRGSAGAASLVMVVVLSLRGVAGTTSLVMVVVLSSVVTSAARAGPAQIRAAPASISTRFIDSLRLRGPRSR